MVPPKASVSGRRVLVYTILHLQRNLSIELPSSFVSLRLQHLFFLFCPLVHILLLFSCASSNKERAPHPLPPLPRLSSERAFNHCQMQRRCCRPLGAGWSSRGDLTRCLGYESSSGLPPVGNESHGKLDQLSRQTHRRGRTHETLLEQPFLNPKCAFTQARL